MKSFILAITSFIATVVLLSQVALAQDDEGWDPKHTVAAQGEEHPTNTNGGRSPNGDQNKTEGSSRAAGDDCSNCAKHEFSGKLTDNTNPSAKPAGGSTNGGSGSQKGTK